MSSPTAPGKDPSPFTLTAWLICIMAAIGFAFDIYELLMLPLIIRPALLELTGAVPGTDEFQMWVGRLFFIPAFAGGIFGLLGGYLTDLFGRRRVLTYSILLYAVSAFLAGYSTNVWMLLFFRSTTFIGVCVEFVAAVAWLAELFPNPQQREKVLGYTQAFSSVGGLLVAVAFGVCEIFKDSLPPLGIHSSLAFLGLGEIKETHAAWRYTLMSGLIPALPLIILRPFLPESPVWHAKKVAGTLRRPSILELFAPGLRKTTLLTTLMFACSYGAAFGAIQMIPQIVPGLPQVQEKVAQANSEIPETDETARTRNAGGIINKAAANYTKVQEVGGLMGRFLLALLVVQIVSRRALLAVFQVPGLIIMPLVFVAAAFYNPTLLKFNWGFELELYIIHFGHWDITLLHVGIFLAGLFTVAQFSFWGNYLPTVFPLHLRGTGESFAANIGGRMIGTSFAWVTAKLALLPWIPGDTAPAKVAVTAAGVAFFVYLVGNIARFFLPEPGPELDEDEHATAGKTA